MKWILKKYKAYYTGAFVLAIIVSLLNIAGANMLGNLLNAAVEDSTDLLFRSAVIIIAVWSGYYWLNKVRNDFNAKIRANVNTELRNVLAHNGMQESNDEWSSMSPAERVGSFTSNIDLIDRNCIDPSLDILYCFFTLIFSFAALTMIHISVSMLAVCMLLSMLFLPGVFKKKMAESAEKNKVLNEAMNQTITDCLYGRNEYRMYQNADRFFSRIAISSSQAEEGRYSYERISDTANALIGVVGLIFQCAFIVLAGYLSIQGRTEVGSVLVVGNLAGTFTQSASMLMSDRMKIKASEGMIPSLSSSKETSEYTDILPIQIESLEGIIINNHEVKYNHLNMAFETNGKYLIKGESGSGKSTLLKMLFQNDFAYTGKVLMNGVDRNEMKELSYKGTIAYMNQDAYILQDTLRNNLCMGKQIPDAEILSVLTKLGLCPFLAKCDDNLDYVIEDRGKNISGGEKQRLCLARALLSGRSILVLDESISAVDDTTKREILKYLTSISDRSIILAAHNLDDREEKLFDKQYVL